MGITLYHGSRGGIVGEIKPVSRERCDFGRGFYMGTNPDQAKTLVVNDQAPYFYIVDLRIEEISKDRILTLEGMDWAYYVLYNRGKISEVKQSDFYKHYSHLGDNKDLIIGPIADDAMNETMNLFVKNQITDRVFYESIRSMEYGTQYVAKTEESCSKIHILDEKELIGQELSELEEMAFYRRKQGHEIARQKQIEFRREGKYFDEILREIKETIREPR